jgi:Eukaryotic protein of unknown function (DUF1764)
VFHQPIFTMSLHCSGSIMGISSPPSRPKTDVDNNKSTGMPHHKSMSGKISITATTPKTPPTRESASNVKTGTAASSTSTPLKNKKRGWDDIESIFDQKKKQQQEQTKLDHEEEKKQQQRRSKPTKSPRRTQSQSTSTNTTTSTSEWVDDGLGGIYNHEGYTGRTSDDGMKIYKAHVISKNIKNAGQTKDCPFDCNCCFI